jgi:endoglucanase
MLKLIVTTLLFGYLASCSDHKPQVQKKGPVSFYGALKTSGNRIIGEKTGKPVQVKGVSFFWSNWSQSFWTARVVDRVTQELKAEIVRAAFGVQDNGVPYPENSYEALYAVVDRAIENDVYVIIDWHSHGADKNPDAAIAFFSTMAQKYGHHDHVIFELFNEPLQIPWSTVKAYCEKVIPAIRAHSDNLIIAGTPTWSQDIDAAAANPLSDSNTAYALHFYVPNHGTSVSSKVPVALSKNVAVFASEWGFWTQESWCQCNFTVGQWMTLMDENAISWTQWSVFDKDEPSSIFAPGSGPDGPLTENGRWLKAHLAAHAERADWRK